MGPLIGLVWVGGRIGLIGLIGLGGARDYWRVARCHDA
jgi:hypothetical protein